MNGFFTLDVEKDFIFTKTGLFERQSYKISHLRVHSPNVCAKTRHSIRLSHAVAGAQALGHQCCRSGGGGVRVARPRLSDPELRQAPLSGTAAPVLRCCVAAGSRLLVCSLPGCCCFSLSASLSCDRGEGDTEDGRRKQSEGRLLKEAEKVLRQPGGPAQPRLPAPGRCLLQIASQACCLGLFWASKAASTL